MSDECVENLCKFRGEGAEPCCLEYRNTAVIFDSWQSWNWQVSENYLRTHKHSFSFTCVYHTCAVLCSQAEREKRFSKLVAGCSLTWIIIAAFIVCLLLSHWRMMPLRTSSLVLCFSCFSSQNGSECLLEQWPPHTHHWQSTNSNIPQTGCSSPKALEFAIETFLYHLISAGHI